VADIKDYLPAAPAVPAPAAPTQSASPAESQPAAPIATVSASEIQSVLDYISARGFNFDPWQVAAFITAVRTKPFVILAGVSGTGKSALPRLIADATGAIVETVPVRPDWNDSSELLGYTTLTEEFRAGHLMRVAKHAIENPDKQHFLLLDEMNIARPEYYFAEVLSRIEEAGVLLEGEIAAPLKPDAAEPWHEVGLPSNLAIIGSVNMDETTFGFSRKVLDRAFVIEFSDVDLSLIGSSDADDAVAQEWPASVWLRESATLAGHPRRAEASVVRVVQTLTEINDVLQQAQLHFGYRVRDEVAMFVLAAEQLPEFFTTPEAGQIDPLDLAISMKVLPRIQGSGPTISNLLKQLAAWAQPADGAASAFPLSAERIEVMQRRLAETGFTNYWT
jgi:hypothetical protein